MTLTTIIMDFSVKRVREKEFLLVNESYKRYKKKIIVVFLINIFLTPIVLLMIICLKLEISSSKNIPSLPSTNLQFCNPSCMLTPFLRGD